MDNPLLSSQPGPRRVRLIVWTTCLAALSLMPLSVKRTIGTTGVLHNGGHLAAFAITGILFLQWRRPSRFQPWLLWPPAAFALALESAEAVLFHNAFEWRDVATDVLGLLTGLLIYRLCEVLGAGPSTPRQPGERP
jgi:hypothetical protein